MRFLILLLLLILQIGCSPRTQKFSEGKFLMHTMVNIDICAEPSQKESVYAAMQAAFQRVAEIGWRMNVYDDRSDVQKINHLPTNQQLEIPADTFLVIHKSKEVYADTNGAFNIGIWPLIQYWKNLEKEQINPSANTVKEIINDISLENIELDDVSNQIARTNSTIEIDLGGIAKGYAIDEASLIIRQHGFDHFQVNAGGDLFVGGKNCQGDLWKIGVRNPDNKDQILDILAVSNVAVTTSGDYEQSYEINGKTYSHIFDPSTGKPQQRVAGATVVAKKAMLADAYTTAFTILDPETTKKLVNKKPDLFAFMLIVDDNGESERIQSIDYPQYLLRSLQ